MKSLVHIKKLAEQEFEIVWEEFCKGRPPQKMPPQYMTEVSLTDWVRCRPVVGGPPIARIGSLQVGGKMNALIDYYPCYS